MGLFDRKKEGTKWDAWIGARIRKAREEKGWTQFELGKAVYKSQTNISDYENGNLEISVVDLMYIALALEKPLTFFTPPKFNGATDKDLTPTQKEIVHYLNQTTEEMELALLEQAKTYAKITQKLADEKHKQAMEEEREEINKERAMKGKKPLGKRKPR
ncbi:MAG TPA: helix-turn-helix transcriptional regulator [Anaerolineae bacterium]|nr:helix-turn-helix transcriptional regulator [Anaerolineae bacterium]